MNTELMTKVQTLIYSNQDKLEALVGALESVCNESNTTVALDPVITPKHPYDGYVVSEKDIGSFVKLWDDEDTAFTSFLTDVNKERVNLPYGNKDAWWDNAEPYTETIKLHFIPFYATADSEMPSELESGVWVAVLFDCGTVEVTEYPDCFYWGDYSDGSPIVVGYQVLQFVNPVLDK